MKKRLLQVDTLRFIAILFIILYHLVPHVYRGGFLGVNIFLVLAGFMNGRNFTRRKQSDKPFNLLASCKRLLKKLYKPLLVFLLLASTYLVIFNRDLLNNWFMQIITNVFFVNNWYQIIQGASYFDEIFHPSILTHLWYLSIYVQFVLLFWIFEKVTGALSTSKTVNLLIIGTLTLVSGILMAVNFTPYTDPTRVYYGTDTRFFSFGIGLIASQISLERIRNHDTIKQILPLVQIGLLALLFLFLYELTDVGTFTYYGGMFLFDIVLVLLTLSLLADQTKISQALTFKPIAHIGERSLGVYLVYYPVFIILQRGQMPLPHWLQNVPMQVVLILVLGYLLERLIASPLFTIPTFYVQPDYNFKENILSYLKHMPIKGKATLAGLCILCLFTLTSFFLSTSAEEAEQIQEEYAKQMAPDQDPNHKEPEGYSEEDIENYVSNLNADKQFFVEPLSNESLRVTTQLNISFIGDSIMLGASEGLRTIYPRADINAEVGRQLYNTNPVIQQMLGQGEINPLVVISLGSNGAFTKDQFDEFIGEFPKNTELFFLTTHVNRPWKNQVNDLLRQKESQYDNVHIIDWAAYYQTIDEPILDADSLHLNPTGRRYYTTLITDQILKFVD